MAGRDITEGKGSPVVDAAHSIVFEVGVGGSEAVWQNTDVAYEVAIGGQPFIYAINDARPYIRQTAPFKKEQFDNGKEPGEQSLTGWWMRSQASFHGGDGIKYYDPSAGEVVENSFADSEGVDVWTKGQVTLLRDTSVLGYPAAGLQANGRTTHRTASIEWTISGTTYEGVMDGGDFNIVRITSTGAIQPLVASADKIYAMATDGVYVYWITNTISGTSKLHMWKKSLNAALGDASTLMFSDAVVVSNATLTFTKERLVASVNNSIYEIAISAAALPVAVYTHPSTAHIWTSAASSGTAIYCAGWNGVNSSIVKFVLDSTGIMPTLTSAITAAEMPAGEIIYAIHYYLGYLMIGTNKGIRAGDVSSADGSILYGPLIIETLQPVFAFTSRDRFVWCASGTTNGKQGLIRIDLGNEIESLRFAYANDLQTSILVGGGNVVSLGFLGKTDQLFFSTSSSIVSDEKAVTYSQLTSNVATLTTATDHGYIVGQGIYVYGVGSPYDSTAGYIPGSHKIVTSTPTTTTFTYAVINADLSLTAVTGYAFAAGNAVIESASALTPSGYIDTGKIRFSTLEPKNFKRLLARGDYTKGSMTLYTIESNGDLYDQISYDSVIGAPEVNTLQPAGSHEYLAYKFQLFRDGDDNTLGPIFTGYQAKATIATPRQRIMQFPVYCFDVETDRYNVQLGYQGAALERLRALENIEANGDIANWQDLTTGESRQVVIEQIQFTRMTPPDKRFDGFGGVLEITIRTV